MIDLHLNDRLQQKRADARDRADII